MLRTFSPGGRVSALVGITAAGALALAGCAGSSDHSTTHGPFVMAISTDVGTLDPSLGNTSAALAVAQYAYDPLVNLDAHGTVVSGLAKEWAVNGTAVNFTLRDDVTCSDGSAFKATTA